RGQHGAARSGHRARKRARSRGTLGKALGHLGAGGVPLRLSGGGQGIAVPAPDPRGAEHAAPHARDREGAGAAGSRSGPPAGLGAGRPAGAAGSARGAAAGSGLTEPDRRAEGATSASPGFSGTEPDRRAEGATSASPGFSGTEPDRRAEGATSASPGFSGTQGSLRVRGRHRSSWETASSLVQETVPRFTTR